MRKMSEKEFDKLIWVRLRQIERVREIIAYLCLVVKKVPQKKKKLDNLYELKCFFLFNSVFFWVKIDKLI